MCARLVPEDNLMPIIATANKSLVCFLIGRQARTMVAICIKRRYYFDRYTRINIYMLKWQHRYLESALVRSSTCFDRVPRIGTWCARMLEYRATAPLGISIQLSPVFYDRYLLQTDIIGTRATFSRRNYVFNASSLTRFTIIIDRISRYFPSESEYQIETSSIISL